MDREDATRHALALRHLFQVQPRLELEFRALLARLFREYAVAVSDDFLRAVILAMPQELMGSFDPNNSKLKSVASAAVEGPQGPIPLDGPQGGPIPDDGPQGPIPDEGPS